MTWSTFAIVAAGVLVAAGSDTAPGTVAPKKDDKDLIQGTWVLVSTEQDGEKVLADSLKARDVKMVYEEDRVSAKMGDMAVYLGTFSLDPSKSPKAYDRVNNEGSPRLGIYKIEGDTLTICLGGVGKDRPSGFSTESGDGASLVVYKRE